MSKLREFMTRSRHRLCGVMGGAGIMALTSIAAFAAEAGETGGSSLDVVAIQQEDLMPLFNAVSSNMGVILKVGIPLFGLFLVISIIPKVIRYFTK